MDTKTAQIYAEPGPGRQLLGAFEKVQDAPVKTSDKSNKLGNSEMAAIREDLALKTSEIKALKDRSSEAGLVQTKLGEKGLEIETKDGDFKIAIGGRLQLDGQINNNEDNIPQSAKLNDGAGLRRGRIHMDGTLYKDYDFKLNTISYEATVPPLPASLMPGLSIQASGQSALQLVNSESRSA